ncbi:MAG TPA: DUF5658 family protein [Gemmataceae bacterium]|nr:DUF5658 family protein [Gemmataceae bacterium]
MGLRIYCALGVALYMLLSLADLVLTTALLRGNRAAYEANPLAAACLESHGWRGLAVYKAGGVAAFLGAIGLLTRRRPRVAAGVVTFGCLVMLGVTGYSHRLIQESRREAQEQEPVWWASQLPSRAAASEPATDYPDECWLSVR